jgi:hypothetical protein
VGLVAREIEARGVATAVLSWFPEYAVAVGAPRVVGIGYPGSVPFGLPGDVEGQRKVLRAALEAAFGMGLPGQRVDLDFAWPAGARVPRPPRLPPIARAIMKKPWLFLKLLAGDVPQPGQAADTDLPG